MRKSFSKPLKALSSIKSILKAISIITIATGARIVTLITGRTNLEVKAIGFLNSFFEKPVIGGRKGPEDYFLWQYSQGNKIFNYIDDPNFTFKNKKVLDLGCGRGGKTAYYKSEGARTVIGVDLRAETLEIAKDLAAKHVTENGIYFLRGNALDLPFPDETFDYLILNDMVEHLFEKDLENILNEMKRVMKSTGSIIIDFPPYYNPRGSHLYDFVYVPYCHLLFSQKALIKFCEGEASPFVVRQFLELNKITAMKFKIMAQNVGLIPHVYKILKNKNHLANVPILENLFIYRVFCMLSKTEVENKNSHDTDVVFISVDPWQEERWARKQMFAHMLSEKFRNVIYYVETGRSEKKYPHIRRLKENLYIVDIPYLPKFLYNTKFSRFGVLISNISIWLVMKFLRIKDPIYIIYQPHNLAIAKKLSTFFGKSLLCYDFTDDWSEFPGHSEWRKNEIKQAEQNVLKEVDLVFAVSEKLLERANKINNKTYYLPNATSFENFNKVSQEISISPEILKYPEPRIGYVGKITPWRIDFDLLEYLAKSRPSWSIIMIGPIHPEARSIIEELRKLQNITFLGPKSYHSLSSYMKGFNACILPHKVDALTESMDPIKLYDYMATGKPVVATGIREALKFNTLIKVAHSKKDFLTCLDEIMDNKNSTDSAEERIKVAKENSWDYRTNQLIEIIEKQ